MSAKILNALRQIPVPIFGSAAYAVKFATRKAPLVPRLAPWAVPFSFGGLWFVWPAVDEEWKGEMGLTAPSLKETVKKEEKSHKVTALEMRVIEATKAGDFSLLEKEWEAFQNKAMNPGEDDDDDDDDEDEDEDDDENEDEEDESDGDDAQDDDDEEGSSAVKNAADEENVLEAIRVGDYSSLEAEWEAFQVKASNPSDDDDDDDEEDDDDDDEEEEEEESGDDENDDE